MPRGRGTWDEGYTRAEIGKVVCDIFHDSKELLRFVLGMTTHPQEAFQLIPPRGESGAAACIGNSPKITNPEDESFTCIGRCNFQVIQIIRIW